ncbi:MAG: ATP-binding protein [Acidilobaceae archaeon]|nr:ATP-binding protein [Acidilobaceae archaeon]MCX8165096.1 ATP-binding protein [Acidilobaceae archaeon]MDW7974387.1 ATP-binding protein [Sulfolobales archaeon]
MIESVPWPLRLLPGLLGVLIALYALGLLELWTLLVVLGVAAMPFAFLLLKDKIKIPRRVGKDVENNYRVMEIEVRGAKSEETGRELAKVIIDRAQKSNVRFALLSVAEGDMKRSFLILVSREREALQIEGEVLRTLLSSLVEGVRVSEVKEEQFWSIASALSRLSLHSRGALLLSSNSLGERSFRREGGEGFSIGEIVDSPEPKKLELTHRDLEGHIGIFGSTGSGKSTTLSLIAEGTWRVLGIPVILLDWTGEHSALLRERGVQFVEKDPSRGEIAINPLDVRKDLDFLVSVMMKALSLTPPQAYMLMKALEWRNPSALRELEKAIEELAEESKWDREVKRALLRKISMLTRGSYGAFRETRPLDMRGIVVIRLDRISNVIARKSFALFLLSKLFMERSSQGVEEPKVLVALDEAHNVFGGEESPFVEQLFSECRKYGIMLAISTQSPAQVPNGVLLNTNNKIVHALRSSRDKEIIAETMSLKGDLIEALDKLSPGEAVVQTVSSPEPTLVLVQLSHKARGELQDLGHGEPIHPHSYFPEGELEEDFREVGRTPTRTV